MPTLELARIRGLELVPLVLASAVTIATACTDAPRSDAASDLPALPAGSPGPAATGDADAGFVHADYGLDQRPSNSTCRAPARPPSASAVTLQQVFGAVTLPQPVAMAQPPGDTTRWFAASRTGTLVSFPAASPPAQPTIVAELATLAGKPVMTDGEGGFLGFAFHPAFATNGRLYVTFTTTGPTGFASEVGMLHSSDGGASFTSYTKVLGFDRVNFYHCGGGIAFGKDGTLFLGFGDGANDTNGQRKTSFFSKVLRIDVDNVPPGQPYGIPTSNPFRAGGGEPAAFAWGFRNPFRLSVDRETGDVWVGDVGEDDYEEIDRVEIGLNYGWGCREGAHPYPAATPATCPSATGLVDPVFEHAHGGGGRSVTGGVVYRGSAIPGFQGTYVYGDFIKQEAWALSVDAAGTATSVLLNDGGPGISFSHFAEGADGEIYGSTLLGGQAQVLKLVPAGPPVPSTFPDRLSKTGCVDPARPTRPAAGLVPYGVNAPLWSDGAVKERWLALPDGATIGVGADGDLDLPMGSVLVKSFSVGGRLVETRLLVRHDDGDWAGYAYEWDDAQTDAVLLPSGKTRTLAAPNGTWSYPSRSECLRCHTAAAGRSLGLEVGQLNGDHSYPSTGRIANQLRTLEHIGMLSAPLGKPVSELAAYPSPFGAAALEARARAYLHGNCSMCHRPGGGPARAPMDFRFVTSFADTKTCNIGTFIDDLGVPGAKILTPGKPEASLISLRMHSTTGTRMPPLGTRAPDPDGTRLIDDWIRAATCP